MKKQIFASLAFFFCTLTGFSQGSKDPVLLTIGSKTVTLAEFEKVYHKNNTKTVAADPKSVKDYLELFINYKLKVLEAEEFQLDTSKSFINELAGYKKQLAQPYLTDTASLRILAKEAYDRSLKDVRASHILIKVNPDASPKDTLAAFKRIMKIRDMIGKGSSFETIARDSSEDPSAKSNMGDLGYFTVLQMVYPFETAAYSGKVGSISMPVRTRFGYHLIKVAGFRENPGEVTVSHILIRAGLRATPEEHAKAKRKIDSLYSMLKDQHANFEELAKQNSEDPTSAKAGGALAPFTTGRMVKEFDSAAMVLNAPGDYSMPVKTDYGWHIIKMISKKGPQSLDKALPDLKSRVVKDSRADIARKAFIEKIKTDYKFQEFPKSLEGIFKFADSTLINAAWTYEGKGALDLPLFNLAEKSFSQRDFAKFIVEKMTVRKGSSPLFVMGLLYEQFVEETVLSVKEKNLEKEKPEYRALMEEYRDGILLFELTDKKVWSRAVKDTAGLRDFHRKNKERYMWAERGDASIFTCNSEDAAKKVKKLCGKKYASEVILSELNTDSIVKVTFSEGLYLKGEQPLVDKTNWEKGLHEVENSPGKVILVNFKGVIPPSFKTLDESRGTATADYQQFLEKEWLAALRAKYKVSVDESVLDKVK